MNVTRARLLQHRNGSYTIGGDIVGGDSEQNLAILEEEILRELSALVNLYRSPAIDVLRQMAGRLSTHAVDRVAGLACLPWSQKIPAYHEVKSPEDASSILVDTMDERCRAQSSPVSRTWRTTQMMRTIMQAGRDRKLFRWKRSSCTTRLIGMTRTLSTSIMDTA
ncbi:hypothetical protein EDD18DRAFT_131017 [Armillaria luteobubalina]|uniref:Uncharacterized protein n=1 Tax=Armillaria luteobubalina TaxID=153913 RepID=A0AA39Q8E0_9AGAR|nr:hypothetical protein EDD18DRAFT_131017 [Armillaria luteobubalina]